MAANEAVLIGDKKLIRKLKRVEKPATRAKIGRKATRAAAKILHQAAKPKAPKDTGALRRSLRVRAPKKRTRNNTTTEVRTGVGKQRLEPTNLAQLVERGTKYTRAQPFLDPTFEAVKGRMRQKLNETMRAEIDKELSK